MKRLWTLMLVCGLGTAAAEQPANPPHVAPYHSYAEFSQQYRFVLDNLNDATQKANHADPSIVDLHWVCVHVEVLVKELQHNRRYRSQFEQDSGQDFDAVLSHWQNKEARQHDDCARIHAQFDAL